MRAPAIVLSLELVGNPFGLVSEVITGVKDALLLPLMVSKFTSGAKLTSYLGITAWLSQ